MGLMGVIPNLPLYLEERFGMTEPGEVETWTAIVFGAGPFTAAVFGPLWGVLGDRVGRKAMILRAHVAIAVALALMPLAEDPYWLTAARVMQGMFAGYIAPAMALVSADVPAGRQGAVISKLQLALALGLALGPPVASEVTAWWGRAAVFWVGSGLALVSALPVILWVREDRSRLGVKRPSSVPGGFASVIDRRLVVMLLLVFLLRFSLHMVEPFTALWVRELGPLEWLVPDGTESGRALDRTVALAFTILAAGQLLMTTTWGRLADRWGPARCLAWSALLLAGLLFAISRVTAIEPYLGLRCGSALFMAGLMTLAYAAVGRRVPGERKATAFALVQSCMQFGLSLGPLFGSAVAPHFGLRGLFVCAAVLLVVVAAGFALLRRFEAR